MTILRAIERETEAARTLLLNIRDIIGDDEIAAADMVEGETALLDEINAAVARISELAALEAALEAQIEQMSQRQQRFSDQVQRIRTAICVAMADTGLKKLELPLATVSLKASPPKVIETDEAVIPARFWKAQDPKLDRRALAAAVKAGETVPGAALSNQPDAIQIRWG